MHTGHRMWKWRYLAHDRFFAGRRSRAEPTPAVRSSLVIVMFVILVIVMFVIFIHNGNSVSSVIFSSYQLKYLLLAIRRRNYVYHTPSY